MGDSTGNSVIRLHRQRGFFRHCVSAYRVRIDGHPAGLIAPGETRDFRVPPGEHLVRLTIERLWGSRKVTLQVREGELAVFTCRPGGGALVLPFAILCGVFVLALVPHSAQWGLAPFAPLCGLFALVLVPRRYIRLDGPTSYESRLSAGMLPRGAADGQAGNGDGHPVRPPRFSIS